MAQRDIKELITFIAKSLVSQPEEVSVQETESSDGIIMELSVASDDMGKVIGKRGRIAKAIRTVVRASVSKGEKPVFVEIVD
jgi:predicted RNA-binding protein YlqC (UPF0109 family)